MLISTAMAASGAANAPSAGETFLLNMLLIVILVGLFYVLLILPQQRRFKEHRALLDSLQKGDKVVTAGGFVGTIDEIKDDKEVIIELTKGVKVTALRSTIQTKVD